MKRLAVFGLIVAIVALSASSAFADRSNTGCGLGSIIIGDTDSLGLQMLATTSNGTFGNQTFGITSGTSNCKKYTTLVKDQRLTDFVSSNMDTIAREMASGKGESLETIAELMAVPATQRAAFYGTLQSNFAKIFTSGDVESADVIDNIVKVSSAS